MAIIICRTGAGGSGFLDFIAAILHIGTPAFERKSRQPCCSPGFDPYSF
jgi:hypothetical protein